MRAEFSTRARFTIRRRWALASAVPFGCQAGNAFLVTLIAERDEFLRWEVPSSCSTCSKPVCPLLNHEASWETPSRFCY
uniref:Putative secreted protein n=1 Tax=Ixodes ricinus TaxID=34613 RepID=A0A6B0U123_IXORI